jgi:hypothetical protein
MISGLVRSWEPVRNSTKMVWLPNLSRVKFRQRDALTSNYVSKDAIKGSPLGNQVCMTLCELEALKQPN